MLDQTLMKRPQLHLPHPDALTLELIAGALLTIMLLRWLA